MYYYFDRPPPRYEYRIQNTEVAWTLGIFAGRIEHEAPWSRVGNA